MPKPTGRTAAEITPSAPSKTLQSILIVVLLIGGPLAFILYKSAPTPRQTARELCTSVRGEDIPAWCAR